MRITLDIGTLVDENLELTYAIGWQLKIMISTENHDVIRSN